MWITLLIFIHIVVYLLVKNKEKENKDLEKKINGPFVRVAPPRFPEYVGENGNYDPDRDERERIACRNREAVEEADRVYKTVGVLKKLNKM